VSEFAGGRARYQEGEHATQLLLQSADEILFARRFWDVGFMIELEKCWKLLLEIATELFFACRFCGGGYGV